MDMAQERGGDFALRLGNTAASVAVVLIACAAYALLPFHRELLQTLFGPPSIAFTGFQFLAWAAGLYSAVLAIYLMSDRDPGISKSLRFFRVLARYARAPARSFREPLAPEDRLAVLTTLLKGFFGPLMTLALMSHCMNGWVNGAALLESGLPVGGIRPVFDRFGFWFLLQVIFFVDVVVFTVGYLVESRRLGNEIRSVDPTLVGWVAAVACYPPFNTVTGAVLGAQNETFPQFDDTTIHLTLNFLILALLAVYSSASLALGLKASNLTHRGVVSRGPYAVVRHPAYACKNIAWWIGSIPLVTTAFHESLPAGLMALGSVVGWTAIYVLRALTEEDHLRRVDGAYEVYAAKVRYRFIPGVI